MRCPTVLAALLALTAAAPAEAGRRPFIWAYDTDVVPEGDLELEQWLWVRGPIEPTLPDGTSSGSYLPSQAYVWWAPVLGVGEHFELLFPFQVVGTQTWAALDYLEADVRWRLKPRNDDDGLQLLLRAAFLQATWRAGTTQGQADLVLSYGTMRQPHLVLDLGAQLWLSGPFVTDSPRVVGTCDLGFAYPVSNEIQIGAESFGELGPKVAHMSQLFVGPDVSWTRGRIWLTAGILIGLTPIAPETPKWMPRLIWAVAI